MLDKNQGVEMSNCRIDTSDNEVSEYLCTLDNASLAKAELEFNENPIDRAASLATFKDWISKQSSWLQTPTDPTFLMSFLRMRKFSQLMARRSLVNYWSSRCSNPQWFKNVDPTEKIVQEIIDCGSLVLLPGRDKHGRKVILLRPGKIDNSYSFTSDQMYKTALIIADFLLRDENIQVNGFIIITDFTYMSIFNRNPETTRDLKKNFEIWGKIYPLHIKEIHHYNMGSVGEFAFKLARPFLPQKIQQRIFNHSQLFTLYNHIDKDMLPSEYLPDDYSGGAGSINSLLDQLKKDISAPDVCEFLSYLSSDRFFVDEDERPDDNSILHPMYRKVTN